MLAAGRLALVLLGAACGGAGVPAPAPHADACDVATGISFHGARRWVHGVNYPWREFGTDFGGLAAWQRPGARGARERIDADFAELARAGAQVVRWWVFPQLRGDGLQRSADGTLAVTPAALADLDAALELAARHHLYLQLTLLSFDGFRAARETPPAVTLGSVADDESATEAFATRMIGAFVAHAAQSRHADRIFAWEVMNEPEWAVSDRLPNTCTGPEALECVSEEKMQRLLRTVGEAIDRARSPQQLVTLGSAADPRRWLAVRQDFLSTHVYERAALVAPSTGRPTVVGELPSVGWEGRDVADLSRTAQALGFAGALGWAYSHADAQSDPPALIDGVRRRSAELGCRARYDDAAHPTAAVKSATIRPL